jgi:hypothetical protein
MYIIRVFVPKYHVSSSMGVTFRALIFHLAQLFIFGSLQFLWIKVGNIGSL